MAAFDDFHRVWFCAPQLHISNPVAGLGWKVNVSSFCQVVHCTNNRTSERKGIQHRVICGHFARSRQWLGRINSSERSRSALTSLGFRLKGAVGLQYCIAVVRFSIRCGGVRRSQRDSCSRRHLGAGLEDAAVAPSTVIPSQPRVLPLGSRFPERPDVCLRRGDCLGWHFALQHFVVPLAGGAQPSRASLAGAAGLLPGPGQFASQAARSGRGAPCSPRQAGTPACYEFCRLIDAAEQVIE